MKRLFLAGLLLSSAGSAAYAASDTGSISATLEITGECEVITASIGATTENFMTDPTIEMITTGDYTSEFDALPTAISAPTTSAGENPNVAVLCSAGGGNHTVEFDAPATLLGANTATTLQYGAFLDGVPFDSGAATATIDEDQDAATLTEFTVMGVTSRQFVADAVPDTYSATISVTVVY